MGKENRTHVSHKELTPSKRPNFFLRIKNTFSVLTDPSKNYCYRNSDVKGLSRSEWVEQGMFRTLEEIVQEDKRRLSNINDKLP